MPTSADSFMLTVKLVFSYACEPDLWSSLKLASTHDLCLSNDGVHASFIENMLRYNIMKIMDNGC